MTDNNWSTEVDALLYQIQSQDKLALKKLYDLTAQKLLGLIIRIVNDRHEAEDILQEVFVKIWQQSNHYSGSGSAWGWVCVMSRNSAIDRLRRLKNRAHESTDEAPELLNQLLEDISHEDSFTQNHWIGRCLETLKPQPRQAIVLSYVNGYSHGELSEKMAVPLGTVKAWIRRGLQELKQCLVA